MEEFNGFVSSAIENYLEEMTPPSPEPALSMEEMAERRDFPIIGPQVGRLIKLISTLIQPDQILEMGSGFGYSAYWFGQGAPDSIVHLTEYDRDNLALAREFLNETEHPTRFRYHSGPALETVKNIDSPLDCVFIDIDKKQYPDALNWARERLEPGGWLIADNVLWKGNVVKSNTETPSTQGIQQFNRMVNSDAWESTIIPLRDGVTLARRTESP